MRAMACIAASALIVVVASGACATKKESEMPGVVAADVIAFESTVEAIDYQKRTITLRGPQGNLVTYKVDESAKRFSDVKKGEQVVLQVTEALAIVVTRP